jgi:hypothetical protein
MAKALRYRLFGMGKMPHKLKAAAASPDVVLADEGLVVHNRVQSLQMPGARVGGGVRTASGAVVILPGRLLASIGPHVVVDTGFEEQGEAGGKHLLTLADDGMLISFDVASVLSQGSGTVDVKYKLPLDSSVLARMPARELHVTLSHAAEAFPAGGGSGGRVSRRVSR